MIFENVYKILSLDLFTFIYVMFSILSCCNRAASVMKYPSAKSALQRRNTDR